MNGVRVALVLPPTQSLFLPYSAPAVLAAWLQRRCGATTLVIDSGVEWLDDQLRRAQPVRPDIYDAVTALRDRNAYRDAIALRAAYLRAEAALQSWCERWRPERVTINGEYTPPDNCREWTGIAHALCAEGPYIFDEYFRDRLLPSLKQFDPDIVALSIPFDWMVFSAMRLARHLRAALPAVTTIVGGHTVNRMWQEGDHEFFRLIDAGWAGVMNGHEALEQLIASTAAPKAGGPLIRLPLSQPITTIQPEPPQFYAEGLTPDYSDLDLGAYLRPEPILSVPVSEGCYYSRCQFCFRLRPDRVIAYRESPPHVVADSIRQLQVDTGTRQFILAGDIVSHRFLSQLAASLKHFDEVPTWFCEATFKTPNARHLTTEFFEGLSQGGCRIILNGLESGSPDIRRAMGCPVDEEVYDRMILGLDRAGIIPYVTLVIGYPGETERDLLDTIGYVQKHMDRALFPMSRFMIYPGTPLSRALLNRADVVRTRRSVLDSWLHHESPDTLPHDRAVSLLNEHLPGMFGQFPEFLREITILMQMVNTSETGEKEISDANGNASAARCAVQPS